MALPEVWSFKPPHYNFNIKAVNSDQELISKINSNYFNHLVSIVLPDRLGFPDSIENILKTDSNYYQASNVKLCDLINHNFLSAFVKSGNLTLMSIGTMLDQDNCVAITPTGSLILLLRKADFEKLGIEGKLSKFSKREDQKFVVNIDLKNENFKIGSKMYERIYRRFKSQDHLCFDLIFYWKHKDEKICPSSIAAYFCNQGYHVRLCSVACKLYHQYNVHVPTFGDDVDDEQILEWLGMLSLQCELNPEPDGFCTTYVAPDGVKDSGQVAILTSTGLLSADRLSKLVIVLREYIKEHPSLPWVSLHVQGFEDSIVNTNLKENNFFTNGDHNYTMFIRNAAPSIVCSFNNVSRQLRYKRR